MTLLGPTELYKKCTGLDADRCDNVCVTVSGPADKWVYQMQKYPPLKVVNNHQITCVCVCACGRGCLCVIGPKHKKDTKTKNVQTIF